MGVHDSFVWPCPLCSKCSAVPCHRILLNPVCIYHWTLFTHSFISIKYVLASLLRVKCMILPTTKRKQILLCGGRSLWGLSVLSKVKMSQVWSRCTSLQARYVPVEMFSVRLQVFPCHFIFFTGLKSFLLRVCRDPSGCPQSHCLKWQGEGLVALDMSEPVPSASSLTAWEWWIIISSSLGCARNQLRHLKLVPKAGAWCRSQDGWQVQEESRGCLRDCPSDRAAQTQQGGQVASLALRYK